MKPTAYWFTNCEPTYGNSYQPTPPNKRKFTGIGAWSKKPNKHSKEETARGSTKAGLCSEERSMISPDYARNFICDFILGKQQINSQLQLFEQ